MASAPLKAAILVVSDTASRDASTDRARDTLKGVLDDQGPGKWSVVSSDIVPDHVEAITNKVRSWCDERLNLIISTGGTGFAIKDVTPEAIEPLIEKKAPGLVLVAILVTSPLSLMYDRHGMLAKSLEITPCR